MFSKLGAFLALVKQQAPFFKVRSVLSLYASIDIPKLARLTDISEEDLVFLGVHNTFAIIIYIFAGMLGFPVGIVQESPRSLRRRH